MTPETEIRAVVSDLWVEKFPQNSTALYPKGLIKRISVTPQKNKDDVTTRLNFSSINILWYDVNTIAFDAKMNTIYNAVYALTSDSQIKSVIFEGRDDGYDHLTDMHVMNLEFLIKHYI